MREHLTDVLSGCHTRLFLFPHIFQVVLRSPLHTAISRTDGIRGRDSEHGFDDPETVNTVLMIHCTWEDGGESMTGQDERSMANTWETVAGRPRAVVAWM